MSAAMAAILLLAHLPGQQPRLMLTDRRLESGTTMRLTGSGFQAGTRPTIALEGARDTVELGFAAAAADGGIELSLDIPRSTEPGAWRLVARSREAVLAALDVAVLENQAANTAPPAGARADSPGGTMAGHDMGDSAAVSAGGGRLFGYDWPLLHAALNDLPSALLMFALLFEAAALVTGKESLRAAGFWTLVAGVAGMAAAAGAGLMAANRVAHDDVAHEVMNRHKLLAFAAFTAFALLLAWRLVRRDGARRERLVWVGAGAMAAGLLIAASQLGGALVFDHALGIPSSTLHTVLERRGDMPAMTRPDSAGADSTDPGALGAPHRDRPGAAPHDH